MGAGSGAGAAAGSGLGAGGLGSSGVAAFSGEGKGFSGSTAPPGNTDAVLRGEDRAGKVVGEGQCGASRGSRASARACGSPSVAIRWRGRLKGAIQQLV